MRECNHEWASQKDKLRIDYRLIRNIKWFGFSRDTTQIYKDDSLISDQLNFDIDWWNVRFCTNHQINVNY